MGGCDRMEATLAGICWYLCVLFAVGLAVAITVDGLLATTFGALSVAFGIGGWVLRRRARPEPRWLLLTFRCLALLATVAVLLMLVG